MHTDSVQVPGCDPAAQLAGLFRGRYGAALVHVVQCFMLKGEHTFSGMLLSDTFEQTRPICCWVAADSLLRIGVLFWIGLLLLLPSLQLCWHAATACNNRSDVSYIFSFISQCFCGVQLMHSMLHGMQASLAGDNDVVG